MVIGMKLKDMEFTKKTLAGINACQDAIDFCTRNGLFCNTQIKNLEIEGVYKGWAAWINRRSDWDLEYNIAGNITKITCPNGVIETLKYDTAGNLVEKINWNGTTETLKYDTAGNLVEKINWNGTTETRKYDASGNLVEIKYWNGNIETREYDSLGNITKICGVNGKFYRYKYKKTENKFTVTYSGETILKIHNTEGWA